MIGPTETYAPEARPPLAAIPEPAVGDIVEVLWEDASFHWDVDSPDNIPDDYPMIDWGKIVKLDDSAISIAAEWAGADGAHRAVTRIPIGVVRGVRVLRRADA